MTGRWPARVLILSAGVGSGHHAAAEGVREELQRVAPDVHVTVRNGLGEAGGALRLLLERLTRWQLTHWPRAYNCSYAVVVRWSLGRRLAQRVLYGTSRATLLGLIEAERPDIVVSTYPGITAPLGVMRERGQLGVPLCALVTDFASLHFWAHPGADLHLASYPESLPEISHITAGAPATATRPPIALAHWRRRERAAGRRALSCTRSARSPSSRAAGGASATFGERWRQRSASSGSRCSSCAATTSLRAGACGVSTRTGPTCGSSATAMRWPSCSAPPTSSCIPPAA